MSVTRCAESVTTRPPATSLGSTSASCSAAGARAERQQLEAVGACLEGAGDFGRDAEGVERAQLHDLVVELRPAAAAQDHVDLLLQSVVVSEGRADAGGEALVGEADLLGLERAAREARLESRREAELDRRVLDLQQVRVREAAHRPTISSGRTGARTSSRPVASRSAATIAAVETTVGGSPTPLTP